MRRMLINAQRADHLRLAIITEGTSAAERVTLLADTKELSRQHGVIEAEIVELERDRAVRAQALFEYRNTLAYDF